MRGRLALVLTGVTAFGVAACGREETAAEREAKLRAARADSVAMAEARYDPSAFDTIAWASPAARLERGGVVWSFSCRKCHSTDGRGGGEFAVQNELDVPSFLAPDWRYAGDLPALRHRIFVGHEGGMPHWGLHGLKYRDIDAVAHYIDELLRFTEPAGN